MPGKVHETQIQGRQCYRCVYLFSGRNAQIRARLGEVDRRFRVSPREVATQQEGHQASCAFWEGGSVFHDWRTPQCLTPPPPPPVF